MRFPSSLTIAPVIGATSSKRPDEGGGSDTLGCDINQAQCEFSILDSSTSASYASLASLTAVASRLVGGDIVGKNKSTDCCRNVWLES